jgi:hypothetical protein
MNVMPLDNTRNSYFQFPTLSTWLAKVKVKVKLSLSFFNEHHAMKAYWGVEVQLHSFFDFGTRWR